MLFGFASEERAGVSSTVALASILSVVSSVLSGTEGAGVTTSTVITHISPALC